MTDAALREGTVVGDRRLSARRLTGRLLLLLVGLALLGAAVRYGQRWWMDGRFIETTDDAYVGGDSTAISPHVAGFVDAVEVSDNQHVAAGQILARLDDRDVTALLDKADAVLRQRRAALAAVNSRQHLQESMIVQAAAELDQRVAQSTFAQKDADRYASLANTPAVTRQEAERSLSLGRAAKASVATAQAALEGARQQMRVIDAQIGEAQAAVAQAEAEVRTAQLEKGYTVIRSPIDGFIGNRAVRRGAYVAVGTYLMTIVPSSGLWVDANFKEDQLRRIRPGSEATVTIDAAPDRPLRGRVTSVAPGTGAVFSVIPPENATGNFTKIVQRVPIRIAFDGDDGALGALRPGLSASVSVDTRAVAESAAR